ncbi:MULTISPECIES: LapA family protein [Deinococcus]|uniref:LapA family protein n=1 Tax=Deinococcus rufus TaxID=2136097 RepID=A0ABV7Z4N5_9DEIO|nr:LapA family protein [Deinococcus sp. AB2017081]WQE94868.1 LapA family protein [Deinococcus sp. AB2017081]
MRTVVLIVVLVVLALFALLNTNSLMFPHTISLGFVTYRNLPMGLILLILGTLLTLVFYFWAGISGLRAQADSARLLRDMEQLRVSLDSKEGSRFAQLQTHIDERLNALPAASGTGDLGAVNARIDALQRDVNLQLAQLDDYLKRKLG